MQIRYITKQISKDLARKMVFLGGPRQVGKTTLAKHLIEPHDGGYLNWDIPEDRERILERKFPTDPVWVFDEIHKYRQWRNLLKGIYDKFKGDKSILVTGSARLDYYRYGGDSLQGRYHYLRLHPLSVAEVGARAENMQRLFELGGFPEPYFSGDAIEAKRWSREYRTRMIRDDILSLEQVGDIGTLERLVIRLPELVGSPLSINAIREDLLVAHKTVARWLDILERMYAIFRISPFGSPKIRAVRKEQKHYHFDWSLISNRSLRFENFVASHLLKWVHFLEDTEGRDIELRYFRDTDKREVDFVITEDGIPKILVECKFSNSRISDHLIYLKRKFPKAEAWQLHWDEMETSYVSAEGIIVAHAGELLKKLC
ncbi:MAG: ATP-binding protein [Proteobacteria bacterium]|nr:ATP-binding protein [Pseudomonadota bacterium]